MSNNISDITVNIEMEDIINPATFGGICLYYAGSDGTPLPYAEAYSYDEAKQIIASSDSIDWKELGVQAEIDRVLNHKHLGNGSIILFHNDAKYTPECLDTIIKGLKEKGFEIVPISQLIHKDNYYMDVEGRQILNN